MMVPKKEPDRTTYSGRFAARLYELRKKAGLSAEQVAEELGVSAMAVYQWEAGSRKLSIELFPEMAKLYKLKKTREILPNE